MSTVKWLVEEEPAERTQKKWPWRQSNTVSRKTTERTLVRERFTVLTAPELKGRREMSLDLCTGTGVHFPR